MSASMGFSRLKRAFPRFGFRSSLSDAGRAGPRRLAAIAGGIVLVAGLVVVVTLSGHHAQPASQDAKMGSVDPLPGGLHSTPEENALALKADTKRAEQALALGKSYTPAIDPSVPVVAQKPIVKRVARADPPLEPYFVAPKDPVIRPARMVSAVPATLTPPITRIADREPPLRQSYVVAAPNLEVEANYQKEIDQLFNQWNGRPPKTTVVLPPKAIASPGRPVGVADAPPGVADAAAAAAPTGAAAIARKAAFHVPDKVLIPAGRGVFAHPILALNSDETSPAIFQADSGPIAGDRMIGSFSRQKDRLIIHIEQIVHDGQSIPCDGVVIAPDTMEASVATGVDEHYLSRIILPAAAAFVQGLGEALATTSNTAAVISPFGGATTVTNLHLGQQLGVAAGAAAGQVGSILNREAPQGPTVTLAANVSVGVMFLHDVKVPANE